MKTHTVITIASFLALFCVLTGIYLNLTMLNFLPFAYKSLAPKIFILNFIGTALGAILCPLFLPVPDRSKPLLLSLAYIFLIILPQIIIRHLGSAFWLGSWPAIVILELSTSFFYPICLGLFFLPQYCKTRGFWAFLFALALLGGIFIGTFFVPLLVTYSIGTDNPIEMIAVLFNASRWFFLGAGLFITLCLILNADKHPAEKNIQQQIIKTNWPRIIRLIGLPIVINMLNAVMEMRLYPFVPQAAEPYKPNMLVTAAVVLIFGWLADKNIDRFLNWFLPFSIVLFILFPCLLLFEAYSTFILFFSTLVMIFRLTIWVIFTIALVKSYTGNFWFYAIVSAMYLTNAFSQLSPIISKALPSGIEYTVLLMGIFASVFLFLAFRIVVPKAQTAKEGDLASNSTYDSTSDLTSMEDLLREHGLSRREIEVSMLLLKEGLGAKEIGQRLFISAVTVRDHITSIYHKFNVKNRGEFMALFVNK